MQTALEKKSAGAEITTAFAADLDAALGLARRSASSATATAYQGDWAAFESYAGAAGESVADPACVAAFVASMVREGKSAATIARRIAGIRAGYRARGMDDCTRADIVGRAVAGARRDLGTKQAAKTALTGEQLRSVLGTMQGSDTATTRNRALLLLGWNMAARRSELVALQWSDIEWTPTGLLVTIRRSKTDQTGEGRVVGVPVGRDPLTCPARALAAWQATCNETAGPIWRAVARSGRILEPLTAQSVCAIVKAAAASIGQDPAAFGGHSLRSGMVTTAFAAGVSESAIQRQTGHKNLTVLRHYNQANPLVGNAAAGLL